MFILKLVAMVTMLVDHVGFVFLGNKEWMRCIGRIAFPLYAFMIAEGFAKTTESGRLGNYWQRTLFLALASEVSYDYAFYAGFPDPLHQNVIFTLWLALSALIIASRIPFLPCKALPIALVAWLAEYLHTSYGWVGVLLVAAYAAYVKWLKEAPGWLRLVALLAIGLLFGGHYVVKNAGSYDLARIIYAFKVHNWLQLGVLGAVPFIYLYNGKKGFSHPAMDWSYRVFYPVHLGIFAIVRSVFSL